MNTIETNRLLLRTFREEDYDDLYEFLLQQKDDEFEGYPDLTYENTRGHLQFRIDSGDFYAIEFKKTGKVIGNIYCGKRDFNSREVGYIVNHDYRRTGIALEALSAVMGQCFSEGIHRIYAECDPRNICSWRLLEKAGLQREASFRKNIFFHTDADGRPIWKDTYVYAILSPEEV